MVETKRILRRAFLARVSNLGTLGALGLGAASAPPSAARAGGRAARPSPR
jgi:hypothetical protein